VNVGPNQNQVLNLYGVNFNVPSETNKIKRKIYFPKSDNFNYAGLIIGPKGANQKRLEEETGCRILIKGKGSRKEASSPGQYEEDEPHVLIVADNEMQIAKATSEIERIIFADQDTRNKIKQEQLRMVYSMKSDIANNSNVQQGSLTTPYGPPSPDAFIIPVPNDCVGLVIGKGGDTIKQLQQQSGATKVQVAMESEPGSNYRNLFVEGEGRAYERVKQMVENIINQQQKLKRAMKFEMLIPNNMIGLIIGKGGETIKGINQRSGATVFIPKECEPGKNERKVTISGDPEQVNLAQQEIMQIMQTVQMKQMSMNAFGFPTMPGMPNLLDPGMAMYYEQYLSFLNPNYAQVLGQQQIEETIVYDNKQ